jgi:hypothetical protein
MVSCRLQGHSREAVRRFAQEQGLQIGEDDAEDSRSGIDVTLTRGVFAEPSDYLGRGAPPHPSVARLEPNERAANPVAGSLRVDPRGEVNSGHRRLVHREIRLAAKIVPVGVTWVSRDHLFGHVEDRLPVSTNKRLARDLLSREALHA